MPDISNYLVKDLKAELTRRRISHKSTAKKDELKALLQKQLDKEEGTKQMKEASSTSAASGSKATSDKTAKKRRREEEETPSGKKAKTSKGQSSLPASTKALSPTKSKVKTASTFPLPTSVLHLIKSFLSPFDLRTHLALSGVARKVSDDLYPTSVQWKSLVLGAGYGRPIKSLAGGANKLSWKEVVAAIVNCPCWGLVEELGAEAWNAAILARKGSKPLTAAQIVEEKLELEPNPVISVIEGDVGHIEDLEVDYDTGRKVYTGVLSTRPSVAFAFATSPVAAQLALRTGWALACNADGVTIWDLFSVLQDKCSEKVQEPRLAMHYASLQKSLSIKKEEWDKYNQSRYTQWLTHDIRAKDKGWVLGSDLILKTQELFNGNLIQLGSGSILFALGFTKHDDLYESDEDY